jgi:DNA-binding transcriptional MerR regulator
MFNPFKKKKAEETPGMEGLPGPPVPPGPAGPPGPPAGRIIPTDEVRALSSRGVPEPDIIRTLRREGYSTSEIDQAMKDALKSRVSGEAYGPPNEYGERTLGGPPEDLPPREEIPGGLGYPTSEAEGEPALPPPGETPPREPEFPGMPKGEDFLGPPPTERAPSRRSSKGVGRREIEELAEVIVEEKLRGLNERFKAIDTQFQQVGKKMETLSGEMTKMRTEKGGEFKGVEDKIDSYSKHIDELKGRMESMEKALKDSLSPMLESMRSLSELVKSMKEKKE